MKAVVEEVDVLRLCHSLGMALSDENNRASMHKFEFGLFNPSKYDADFARFVREQLVGAVKPHPAKKAKTTLKSNLKLAVYLGRKVK
ncbi:unnamed protein product [Phytophthora lilii]|uniref:Unnamed protein product n=1 Tax=Phytophthora lilii TaxID=2077276 RepID=A0A9W6WR38_9STRA|nr:unnamed protein product [Phytophthora lilii]